MKFTKHLIIMTNQAPYIPNVDLDIMGNPRWYKTPGSPQTNATSPAIQAPRKTPPIVWPALRPLAMLLDPRDHAVVLKPAAILLIVRNINEVEVEGIHTSNQ
jgi:hypothetical protein